MTKTALLSRGNRKAWLANGTGSKNYTNYSSKMLKAKQTCEDTEKYSYNLELGKTFKQLTKKLTIRGKTC